MTEHNAAALADESKPWWIAAYELREDERWCTCCTRDLTGHAARMLELDQRDNAYHDFGDVPVGQSQGWFPFGLTCARKKIREAKARREALHNG